MSKSVASTLPVGPVSIYWNDKRMGSPKSQATVRYNKETVQSGLEDAGVNVLSHKTKETCEVDVVIADFKSQKDSDGEWKVLSRMSIEDFLFSLWTNS